MMRPQRCNLYLMSCFAPNQAVLNQACLESSFINFFSYTVVAYPLPRAVGLSSLSLKEYVGWVRTFESVLRGSGRETPTKLLNLLFYN